MSVFMGELCAVNVLVIEGGVLKEYNGRVAVPTESMALNAYLNHSRIDVKDVVRSRVVFQCYVVIEPKPA